MLAHYDQLLDPSFFLHPGAVDGHPGVDRGVVGVTVVDAPGGGSDEHPRATDLTHERPTAVSLEGGKH